MNPFSAVADWFRGQWVSEADIRAETWALGVRHRGEPLAGARLELKEPAVPVRRSVLLRAVIRDLRHRNGETRHA